MRITESASTIGPERERREDHQPGGEDDDGDEQHRRTSAPSVRNVPAEAGTIFFAAERARRARARRSSGTKRPR